MSEKNIKILYVDDDAVNLSTFKASFRRDYHIFIASSAEEGLSFLSTNEVHIIIADQRMPEMTGVDFFEKVVQLYPDPVRMLLTGYSDIDSVVNAINKGQVFRYIMKPWNENEIKVAIENAFEMYDVKKRLERSNKELIKRNEELSRFVYSASHELKAPIATIMGILKMAQEYKDIDSSEYFNLIQKCASNLDDFVKSIVEYYRNQKYEDYLKEVDFDSMIKSLIESYLFHSFASEINFKVVVNQTVPFVNDEFRCRVIINNILSNCIKYQRKDETDKSISIKIDIDEKYGILTFEDNGIGINKDYVSRIFNMFFRATDSETGSGIGLYIVKEAVEKMLGTIDVDSDELKGSRFVVKIPNRVNEINVVGVENLLNKK